MHKPITVKAHLSIETIERRYRKAWATAATAMLVARSSSRKNNKHSSTKPSMSLQSMAVWWGA